MMKLIKKIIHFLSLQPIVGRPVRIIAAVYRLPQMRDLMVELDHKNNIAKQQIIELDHRINTVNLQITELKILTDEARHHQHVFDEEYWPLLVDSLNYLENLKKSLPVVLRQHHRAMLKHVDSC
jgi:hypothetical protein